MSVRSTFQLVTVQSNLPAMPERSDEELAAWHAELDRKRAENARRRALDAAALESQRNARTGTPRKVKAAEPEAEVTGKKKGNPNYKGRPRNTFPFNVEDILRWRKEGKTWTSIAEHYGCAKGTLTSWWFKNGPRPAKPRKKLDEYTREEVLAVYEEYSTQDRSLKNLSISEYAAVNLFYREGLALRTRNKEGVLEFAVRPPAQSMQRK